MKKILLTVLIAFSLNAKSQITLEQTYDSAATWNTCMGNVSQLMIVKFEVSGEHYVKINRCGDKISIYNLSHVLVKNISLSGLPHNSPYVVGPILYLSENLFDNDSQLEFMYVSDSAGFYTTKICNEDGTILFTTNGIANIIPNIQLQQYPIYNTAAGTKMILSYQNGQAKVFSLAGSLTTAIEGANEELLNGSGMVSNPFPNPTSASTRIDYSLPKGINQGEIVFYDMQGKEIKRFSVDNTFNNLMISTSDIAAGTYFYQLQTSMKKSEGKKIVVIK